MAISFDKESNYSEDTSFSQVVFGSGSPVLEVELNEIQEIISAKFKRFIRTYGKGVFGLSNTSITYEGGILTISDAVIFDDEGRSAYIEETEIALSEGEEAYILVREVVANSTSTLHENGDEQADSIPNNIKDLRMPTETTRRKVVQYTLAKGSSSFSGYTPLKVGTVVNGVFKEEKSMKVADKATLDLLVVKSDDIYETLEGCVESVLGVKGDVANIKTDIANVKTDIAGVKTDISNVKIDIANVKTNIDSVSTDVNVTKGRVDTVIENTNGLKTKVDIITTKLDTLAQNVESIKTKADSIKTSVDNLSTDINTTKTKVDTVITNTSEIKNTLNTVYNNVNSMNTKVDSLGTKVDIVKSTLDETEMDIRTDITNVQMVVDTISQSVQSLFKKVAYPTYDHTCSLGSGTEGDGYIYVFAFADGGAIPEFQLYDDNDSELHEKSKEIVWNSVSNGSSMPPDPTVEINTNDLTVYNNFMALINGKCGHYFKYNVHRQTKCRLIIPLKEGIAVYLQTFYNNGDICELDGKDFITYENYEARSYTGFDTGTCSYLPIP